jgi:hypothetical protein
MVAADVNTPSVLEQKAISVTGPVWETLTLDCSSMLAKDRFYLTNPIFTSGDSNSFGEVALRSYTPGLFLASIDGGAASTGYGRIMIDYEMELYDDINTPTTFTAAD